eukprot:4274486-Amphidinium_carterae.1
MARTRLLALTAGVGHEMRPRHLVVFFAVNHAAQTPQSINCHRVSSDGHTAEELRPGSITQDNSALWGASDGAFGAQRVEAGPCTYSAENERWGYDPVECVVGCPWGAKERLPDSSGTDDFTNFLDTQSTDIEGVLCQKAEILLLRRAPTEGAGGERGASSSSWGSESTDKRVEEGFLGETEVVGTKAATTDEDMISQEEIQTNTLYAAA